MSNPGWVYKPKWRLIRGGFHCFMKDVRGYRKGYESLCGRFRLKQSGGGTCCRPIAVLRCAACDIEEMRLFGVEESLPESFGNKGVR